MVNPDLFIGVGIEINASHIKALAGGMVTGICKPIHAKGMNHIWEIKIYRNRLPTRNLFIEKLEHLTGRSRVVARDDIWGL